MEQLLLFLKPVIESYAGNYGPAVQIVSIIGTLRLLIKPAMEILKVVVAITPSKSDDNLPEKVEASKPYKAVVFCLDWLASIKIKK